MWKIVYKIVFENYVGPTFCWRMRKENRKKEYDTYIFLRIKNVECKTFE